jgi:Xaa-Pro aminopeptidase
MPKEEWESRIKKARALMKGKGLDAVLILNNDNRLYFYGFGKPYRYGFPNVGIIPQEGPTTLILGNEDAHGFSQVGFADRLIGFRGDSQAPTPTSPDPVKLAAEVMEDLGLDDKRIGMEFGQFMWWEGFNINEWEQFKKELPRANFVDATDLFWQLRMVKSRWEIEVERYLYRSAARGYFQIINNARPGKNEKDLFYDALKVWMEDGIIDSLYEMRVINAREGIGCFRNRILKEGDWIFLDGGPSYKGYSADIQRFIYIGDPDKELKRIAHAAAQAQEGLEALLKPGMTAGEIWKRSHELLTDVDPTIWQKVRSRRWLGWVGHGQGLNLHEPPYLCEGSGIPLQEGMVISVEIPAFYKGMEANMPEDAYLITRDGFEKLSMDLGPMDIYIKT